MQHPFLEVRNLSKAYPRSRYSVSDPSATLTVVNRVSFECVEGETLGIVGESGSGKTTLGMCLTGLVPPTAGEVILNGKNRFGRSYSVSRSERNRIQIIFQNPYASLNPKMTIETTFQESLILSRVRSAQERKVRIKTWLDQVALPEDVLKRYPHELSGGQRQRVSIARTMFTAPPVIIGDEVVSALDVSVQAQILQLLIRLQKEYRVTYLFISHDVSVVRYISHRIAVMFAGQMVELGDADAICSNPQHPYSQLLIASIPTLNPTFRKPIQAPDSSTYTKVSTQTKVSAHPDWIAHGQPKGCSFAHRCPKAFSKCMDHEPLWFLVHDAKDVSSQGRPRNVRCWLMENKG